MSESDCDSILSRLSEIGAAIHSHTSARDAMASERRDLYAKGVECGLTHRAMAEAQGITEGAVALALRKMPGRVPGRRAAPAAVEG